MSDQWREALYLLGFLSTIAFGVRMLTQWLYSEHLGKSVVTRAFWLLSISGNTLLALHSFFQLQFHVFIAQVGNGVIAWRNLNLMTSNEKHFSTRATLGIMLIALFVATTLFASQTFFTDAATSFTWFRIPKTPWSGTESEVAWFWHVFGTAGILLFNSRFWFQWWNAEHRQRSFLSIGFWSMSITGELICLVYFLHILDFVNAIGPLFAIIPYARNLMLMLAPRRQVSLEK